MPPKKKFSDGAIVTNAKNSVALMDPAAVRDMALAVGLDDDIVPEYGGDRMAVFRTFRYMRWQVGKDGWMLRPISKSGDKKEVVWGIVKEKTEVEAKKLSHSHEALVEWFSEKSPEEIQGKHPIAQRINQHYQKLRNKIHGDDWTSAVRKFLVDKCKAISLRGDEGVVYWCPPQTLPELQKVADFLSEYVNYNLIICRIEKGQEGVVQVAVSETLSEKLDKLQQEVKEFDGTERATVYTKRMERFQDLRKTATLYRSALGIGIEQVESTLSDLEAKMKGMLSIRQQTVVKKDGTIAPKGGFKSSGLKKFDLADNDEEAMG